ncbi:type VII secretion protein EssA [Listeria kieliensis]|uniref:Uncharacterized protein n=1 Tax=Listeria kieliensis TaxID=1621700 RepID=A0A3D8TRF3_9LIST|nr:type VII secretion protein EssA [Listeria kieliensis]RDX01184.1 hypothetical protein UR08_09595 [Listeria kieliensis]
MKVKLLSLSLLVILACFSAAPLALAAGTGYLESDGSMDLKTDRLQKTDEEKQEELKKAEPTMLDQLELPLFTKDLEKKIKAQQKKDKKNFKDMQDQLFTGKPVKDETAKTAQKELFKKTNVAQASEAELDDQAKEEKNTESKSLFVIIGAVVVALVGGIYFASRNIME